MKKAILGIVLLAGSALAGPRISVGIGFGAPPPVAVIRPACPGPGYVWVDGYYGAGGVWVPGFWRVPAVVVAPEHYVAYDRGYNHDRDRDRGHDRDRGRDFHHDFRR